MMARPVRSGVPSHASLALLWSLFLFGVLLAGCAPVERQQARVKAWWAEVSGTASGAIAVTRDTVQGTVEAGRAAVELGAQVMSGAQATVEEIQERAAKVQEGARKIQEGKKLIEEGVGN